MRFRTRYNRRIIDLMGFEPIEMRLDVRYGGEGFEEADSVLLEEIERRENFGR
jgi:hypothetical protein